MALLDFFLKKNKSKGASNPPLPDPLGRLGQEVGKELTEEANKEVAPLLEGSSSHHRREPYLKVTSEQKAIVAKYAAEHSVTKAIRRFSKDFEKTLRESTVRGWKKAYLLELQQRKKSGSSMIVSEIAEKKNGCPLMLGEELDRKVRAYVQEMRRLGNAITTRVVMAGAFGIVKKKNKNLLAKYGGHIVINKSWARYLLQRMNYVKRKACSKAKVSVPNFDEVKANFLCDIKATVEMEEIPPSLIINWDHTSLKYVPSSSWTMAEEGSKCVDLVGIDDKRQITAVLAVTLDGNFLPVQLVYQGKTSACLPRAKAPSGWHLTYTHNHWSTEETTKDYIEKIILPYVTEKKKELKLRHDHHALCIFDNFKGQLTDDVLQLLERNNIDIAFVPTNCTDRLQPLDLSVNKLAKDFLRDQFQEWHSDQLNDDLSLVADPVTKFPLNTMKPLVLKWMEELQSYMLAHPNIIKNGFRAAGITDALNMT